MSTSQNTQGRNVLNLILMGLYWLVYTFVPLVLILRAQNAVAGESVLLDLFLGFGNLAFFMIVIVSVIAYFPRENKKALLLFVGYLVSIAVSLYMYRDSGNAALAVLTHSQIVYASLLFTVFVLFVLLFKQGGLPTFKREKFDELLGILFFIGMIVIAPVVAGVVTLNKAYEAHRVLIPDQASWVAAGIILFTVADIVVFHYKAIILRVGDGSSEAKKQNDFPEESRE